MSAGETVSFSETILSKFAYFHLIWGVSPLCYSFSVYPPVGLFRWDKGMPSQMAHSGLLSGIPGLGILDYVVCSLLVMVEGRAFPNVAAGVVALAPAWDPLLPSHTPHEFLLGPPTCG